MDKSQLTDALTEETKIIDELSSDVTTKDTTDSVIDANRKPRLTMKPPLTRSKKSGYDSPVDEKSSTGEPVDEDPFDTFILNQFNPFSGFENVIEWLDSTDEKFNQLKISRKLRYVAVPLLVTGKAKRVYLLNQEQIKTYDDFYRLLLTYFDDSTDIDYNPRVSSFAPTFGHGNLPRNVPISKSVVFEDQQKSIHISICKSA